MAADHDTPFARVGCAGWAIPGAVSARVDGEGSHLARYARLFGAVEINSTFYKAHQPKTFARWAASVPDEFRFSVKLPRSISHDSALVGIAPLVAQFAEQAGALGDRLGCVLVQLPPRLVFDRSLAQELFGQLQAVFPCMLACEARHASWFGSEATLILSAAAVTRVIADPPAGLQGAFVPTTADIYARLHGAPRMYYSAYAPDYLAQLGRDLRIHAQAGRQVWCIFDNTASGAAMSNALDLIGR